VVNGFVVIPPLAGPFGGTTLPFERWLQIVFVRALRRAANEGKLPASSQVGVAAFRNFDGVREAEPLIKLLSQVDRTIESARGDV
jgi:hypothetical protein